MLPPEDRIEFDSMIDIHPSQGNPSRGVDDPTARGDILRVIDSLIVA